MSFVVEVHDPNGRQGVLDIGEDPILTPAFVPSDEVRQEMGRVPGGTHYCDQSISESDVWVQQSMIECLRRNPEEKEAVEDAVCARVRGMSSSSRLLHFNFFSDVTSLEKDAVIDLLRLQYRAGADVIEIPHAFCDTRAYERAVRYALEWQQNTWSETPLMGIARTTTDLAMLNHYLPELGGVGIDCRRLDKPLLGQVHRTLKSRDVWVHAFSAPLLYYEVQNQGGLGMLINWFGVDTVSTTALSEHVRRYFTDFISVMDERERADFVRKNRYFAPSDYSMFTFEALEELYGPEQLLSRFCDCPVCRNQTLGDAMGRLADFDLKNQLHSAFAFCRESQKYRHALIHNTTDRFIAARPFAAEILRCNVGQHRLNGRCSSVRRGGHASGENRSDRGPVKSGSPYAAPLM